MSRPLGLLAGSGQFPAYLMEALKERGHEVVVVGFNGETSRELAAGAARSLFLEVGELEKVISFLKESDVKEALMAGYVSHTNLFRMDSLTARVFAGLRDKRADTLLKAAAWSLKRAGINLVSAMPYLKPMMIEKGTRTRREPTAEEWADIKFGHMMARKVAGLDIGQTVVVKHQALLAVEAMEGTDAAIERGGHLGRGGVVVVKVARPRQDFRFDVPVIGKGTVTTLNRAGAAVLAVEAGRTIVLDRVEVIRMADEAGVSIVAL